MLLAGLVRHLAEPLHQATIAEAAATAVDDGSPLDQAAALAELAPYAVGSVGHNLLREALHITNQIADEPQRASALAALAPYLSDGLMIDAFDLARTDSDFDPCRSHPDFAALVGEPPAAHNPWRMSPSPPSPAPDCH